MANMPIEIERKFLVVSSDWKSAVTRRQSYQQGYVSATPRGTVRVRLCASHATLAVKGPRKGCVRQEFEYVIPVDHADDMLRRLCAKPLVEKVRHWVNHGAATWQVDEYCGAAAGLVLAEIELERPDQMFALPEWVGAEVTNDPRYRNSAIVRGAWRRAGKRRAAANPPAAEPSLAP
jgi:adenylate cyclase